MKNRQHWVFDLDGTLINTFPFYLKIVRSILDQHEIVLSSDETIACLGQNARTFFESRLGLLHVPAALQRLREQSLIDVQFIRPFDGIFDLLTYLKGAGNKIAIWTSRDFETAKLVLMHTGLHQYVDHLVSGDCVAKHKPEPEGLTKIAAYFGCLTSDLVVVGDHDVDVLGANKVDAFSIRAAWHDYQPPAKCRIAKEHFDRVSDLHHRILKST